MQVDIYSLLKVHTKVQKKVNKQPGLFTFNLLIKYNFNYFNELYSYNTLDVWVWVIICQFKILKLEAENIFNIWIN